MDGIQPQVIQSIEILVLHHLLQHHQLQPLTLIHHSEVKTVLVMDHDSGISVVLESHAVTLLKAVISENEGIQDAVVGILAVQPHEELQVTHGNHNRIQTHNRIQIHNRIQTLNQILLHQAVNRMEVSVVYQISAVVRTVEVVEQQRVDIVADEPILCKRKNAFSIRLRVTHMTMNLHEKTMEHHVALLFLDEVLVCDDPEIIVLHLMIVGVITRRKKP